MEIMGIIVNASIIWISLAIIFVIIEALTSGLVTIWFALGAVVAGIVAIYVDNLLLQLLVFLAISSIAIAFTRPIAQKYLNRKVEPTNLDAIIGGRGVVTTEITRLKNGRVSVCGKDWAAVLSDDERESIKVGSEIEVCSIKGVSLVVKRA